MGLARELFANLPVVHVTNRLASFGDVEYGCLVNRDCAQGPEVKGDS